MKIIPVLDILDGIAVHAVKGRRKEYQPLKSVLCKSADPIDVATAFRTVGFGELYVADLDAIMGGQPCFSLFEKIANDTGLSMMVDAGITNLEMAKNVINSGVSKIIIGTETLSSIDFIAEAIAFLGAGRVVVSFDLMGNRILSGFELGRLAEPLSFLHELEVLGVLKVIVLDLAKVGSRKGVNMSFVKEVVSNINSKVFVGGGVRDIKDLNDLKKSGASGVLIATALHSGKILSKDLKESGFL